ncbi:MAG: LuxR C-terminal-related transcriptional regulator [Deltaproteobacteria bacterium]|nr:LuxR C-terminal-related transcriptional regulator [Deltaproteobacteria bacterium]
MILEIDKIKSAGDTFELRFIVSKDLYPHFKSVLEIIGAMSVTMGRMARVAEQLSDERRAARDKELRGRDDVVLAQIKARFGELCDTLPCIEAQKVITKEFREWWWIRQRWLDEIRVKREFEIMRLHGKGLSSKEIAKRVGLHPGTVRNLLTKVIKGCKV